MTYELEDFEVERYELYEAPRYRFKVSRRGFVQCVGTGLLITWGASRASAQSPRRGGSSKGESRFHIGKDGMVTALTGKVEVGQGSRTQIAQAVAEELGVDYAQVQLIMADTGLVPDDGGTFGSRTTPSTVPTVRKAAAGARGVLAELACKHWGEAAVSVEIREGTLTHPNGKTVTLGELASSVSEMSSTLAGYETEEVSLKSRADWKVLGQSVSKANSRNIVTGAHRYPSDIRRPNMLYGKVLRPPTYTGVLEDVDLSAVKSMTDVVVVRDGTFVGVAAPSTFRANEALEVLAKSATWTNPPHPSSDELYDVLKEKVVEGSGRRRSRVRESGDVSAALASADDVIEEKFEVPYIAHAPMEPRAAVAEWDGDKVTVWTGGQVPFGVRNELAGAFSVSRENVRVIIPDTGGGFGGKHTGDAAVEAARLAKAAGRPVAVHWTREEEFTWAYFRPAALIEVSAAVEDGKVSAWDFANYNSGGSALVCPYTFANIRTSFRQCDSPLREGSYRGLASTANNFAREVFVERLVAATKGDSLEFRLKHLGEERLANVLRAAADAFGWKGRVRKDGVGYGLSCGTEKNSFLATCVEVAVDRGYEIKRVVVAYECGAIQNPKNLQSQVEGSTLMGLGAVLREEIAFRDGHVANTNFKKYEVPRFEDVPPMEVVLVDRPDLPSVGGSETPIMCIAPAVANAVADATGKVITRMPVRLG